VCYLIFSHREAFLREFPEAFWGFSGWWLLALGVSVVFRFEWLCLRFFPRCCGLLWKVTEAFRGFPGWWLLKLGVGVVLRCEWEELCGLLPCVGGLCACLSGSSPYVIFLLLRWLKFPGVGDSLRAFSTTLRMIGDSGGTWMVI
jgi:hypothetical protein